MEEDKPKPKIKVTENGRYEVTMEYKEKVYSCLGSTPKHALNNFYQKYKHIIQSTQGG
jgi:hypothetical protein